MDTLLARLVNSIIQSTFIYKVILAAGILIVARVAIKVFHQVLWRWQMIVVNRAKDSLAAKYSLETRLAIIKRIITIGVYFFALVFIFLQFDAIRSIGVGLFASAGLASLVIGLAAQNTISNIIAGVSISFSQPIRLHDAVIFRKEFGYIEEISLTHSTILTWDNRRIIVPNSVMANEVIENWTIKDTSLIGSVMFYVDYACDVEKVKGWAKEIVAASPFSTDERLSGVQIVDFTEHAMAMRILVKGPDPGKTWDLRCEMREKLIKKFQEAGLPLPQTRVSVQQ